MFEKSNVRGEEGERERVRERRRKREMFSFVKGLSVFPFIFRCMEDREKQSMGKMG